MVFCGFVPLGYVRVIVPTDVSEVQVSQDFFFLFFFEEKKVTLSIYQRDHAVAIACGCEP